MVAPSARPPPEDELLDELLEEELELDELELELEELLDELLELLDELEELEEELLELEEGSPEELPAPPHAMSALMVRHKTPCLSSVSG